MHDKHGARQGCTLPPILFNLYNELLIEEALENVEGIKVNGKRYTDFWYADDTLLMADNETALQNMINEVIKTCKTYGMALNPKKTKVMVVSKKESPVITIFAEQTRLEQVKEFKYLGS